MGDEVEVKGVKGDVVAATGTSNIVGKEITIKGNIIQIVNPTPEAIERLKEIIAMPTEVQPGKAAGIEGGKTNQMSGETQKGINEMLSLLRGLEKSGGDAKEVVAGQMHISRVELLVKQAVLLKVDADQVLFDYLAKNRGGLEADVQGANVKSNLEKVLVDFDDSERIGKLKESYALLEEANKLDPTDTEVLLHMAQLLIDLTPDDPSDEARVLYRIQNLLNTPRDDAERFRLAQAIFLLAVSREPVQTDSLRDARSMFEKLGRSEWVRQCDDLLAAAGAGGLGIPQTGAMMSPPAVASPIQPASPPAAFQPAGRWHVQVTEGSQMFLDIYPNGAFQGVQQARGLSFQFAGQWVFSPYNNMLQFQGLVNGLPFALGIMIQGPQAGGYYGIGTDGYGYLMMPG